MNEDTAGPGARPGPTRQELQPAPKLHSQKLWPLAHKLCHSVSLIQGSKLGYVLARELFVHGCESGTPVQQRNGIL